MLQTKKVDSGIFREFSLIRRASPVACYTFSTRPVSACQLLVEAQRWARPPRLSLSFTSLLVRLVTGLGAAEHHNARHSQLTSALALLFYRNFSHSQKWDSPPSLRPPPSRLLRPTSPTSPTSRGKLSLLCYSVCCFPRFNRALFRISPSTPPSFPLLPSFQV